MGNLTCQCPICSKPVEQAYINAHIDSNCSTHLEADENAPQEDDTNDNSIQSPNPAGPPGVPGNKINNNHGKTSNNATFSSFFQPHTPKTPSVAKATANQSKPAMKDSSPGTQEYSGAREYLANLPNRSVKKPSNQGSATQPHSLKRTFDESNESSHTNNNNTKVSETGDPPVAKRTKMQEKNAPLAERMRPKSLDEVQGQELVGPDGILRGLVETERVPSMILWGGPGTGKTTIARLIAKTAGSRFVEINSTSSGVGECKKLFAEAANELSLTGRKTIIFCDEIHRFSKSQQDVFLGPVEAGTVTLIGATAENPSFKVVNPLLSRCRTFTLSKLTEEDVISILRRALNELNKQYPDSDSSRLVDDSLLTYLSAFSDGDARTALNLLDLAFDLSIRQPHISQDRLKKNLTHTMVYDRAGDQHYDTISAFHKSVRGSDADAALYYLARMIQSGEDALYIARRMVVIASEDIGLADNSMLPLAISAYHASEKVGLPEARINLAHVTVALCLAPKSTRAYRGLSNAFAVLREPGIAGLPVPLHLRNAPTKLMRELEYGKEYKYNPDYVDGKVEQEYLPEKLKGYKFLEDIDLGSNVDQDLNSS